MIFATKQLNSTAILLAGYAQDAQTLRICFRHGGVYDYSDVPFQMFQELLEAESCGQYYQQIKGNYHCQKLPDKDAQQFLINFMQQTPTQTVLVHSN